MFQNSAWGYITIYILTVTGVFSILHKPNNYIKSTRRDIYSMILSTNFPSGHHWFFLTLNLWNLRSIFYIKCILFQTTLVIILRRMRVGPVVFVYLISQLVHCVCFDYAFLGGDMGEGEGKGDVFVFNAFKGLDTRSYINCFHFYLLIDGVCACI